MAQPEPAAVPAVPLPRRRYRWVMILVVSLAMIVGFLDRGSVSILIVDRDFLETMGILGNPAAQGTLVTAFLLTYGFANIILGPLIDWLGARNAMLIMFVCGALASVAGAFTSVFGMFIASRLARGFFDAPQFPLMNRYVKNWFPPRERGTANATWLTAVSLSSAVALPLTTAIIAGFGWRTALIVLGLLVLVIAAPLVWFFTTDKPAQSRFVSPEELQAIEHHGDVDARAVAATTSFRSGARVFITNPDFWLLDLFHISTLSIYWGILTWMPKYLAEARGFSLEEMGVITGGSFAAAALATILFGLISDRLPTRAPLCAVMLFIVAGAMLFAARTDVGILAGIALGTALTARAIASPNLFALLQRIIPANVISSGTGLDNGISNLGSALTPALVGVFIGLTGSYEGGLLFMMGVALIGGFAMIVLSLKGY